MKVVRGFLLGTAAGLLTVAGAHAADLPVKAKPVEYVKICSVYGAGYYFIPGTDVCIKVGGYLRAEVNFNASGSHTTNVNGPMVQYNRLSDTHTWRSRASVTFDARTQTEYGTLRSYADWWFTSTNGADTLLLNRGFIQFAGFTFGRVGTAAVAPWAGLPGTSAGRFMGADDVILTNAIQYTATLGNGVSATIALEDAFYRQGRMYDRADAISSPVATAFATFSNGGVRFPDIVGNIQINQTWGTAFLSGQAAQKFPGYYGATEDTGSPGSQWGYAVMAGLNFKLPQLGAGDQLWIEGTWTKGILSRLQGATPFQAFGVYGSSAAGYQSLAFGYALDGIFNASTLSNLELTSGWGIAGGIEHFWVPGKLRSSLFASYSKISYGENANAWLCSKYGVGVGSNGLNGVITGVPGGAGGAAGAVCDFDFSTWQVGSRSIWTPVAGFDFVAEILYTAIDQNHSGFLNTTGVAPAGLKPQANYELKDQGIISGLLRAQRNF